MAGKRKIIVYIATSADGFIARLDGAVDWLNRPRPKDNYGIDDFYRSIDTVLWGRKTFEPLLKGGKWSAGYGPKAKHYIFSHHPPDAAVPGAEFVREPVEVFASRLRAQRGKHIWMMGGGGIIASFLDAGEIDEFMIHVIPIFIGEGIPLIAARHRTVRLQLLSAKPFPDGVVCLHYAVAKPGAPPRKRVRPQRG